jgi:large subunit ribosomal protein L17
VRHLKRGRKFGRKKSQKRAFLKVLAANLILREKIFTTEARAKEMKRRVDKLIGFSRRAQFQKKEEEKLAIYRQILERLSKTAAKKLFDELGKRYQNRSGGYTRIVKAGFRKKDGARMTYIELVKE